jgi:predicted nucleic acid-binding protein
MSGDEALVIDASVAVKWLVEEDGTAEALALRGRAKLIEPDLLTAECANIFWKKVQRGEVSKEEALLAAKLLQAADIEFAPTRALLEAATRIAIELDHPAYDRLYLAVALDRNCRFVTADQRLLRKIREGRGSPYRDRVVSLAEAAD